MSMFNTLYSRLALVLFLLVCLISLAFVLLARFANLHYQQELTQKLNSDLARNLVAESRLLQKRQVNRTALRAVFHALMMINPRIEVYLLDPKGHILAYSAPREKIRRTQVALGPLKRFLSGGTYPILGDDPRDPNVTKVFSVAPVRNAGRLEGYLYVILGGEHYDNVTEMLAGSYILRISTLGLAASLLVALVAGLLLFAWLTRRLTRLSRTLQTFTADNGGAGVRYPLPARARDEIDQLGGHFNALADRIEAQVTALKANDAQRRALVANVSHDLRTPLASLHGYLETLLMKDAHLDAAQRRHYLEIATGHSQQLARLVAELFELATLEAADTVAHPETFSLAELVQDGVSKFQLAARQRGVSVVAQLGAGPAYIHADIGMIQRVLDNLIDNALQHTPEGGCVVVSLVEADDGGQGEVRVSVRDTGAGIPAEDLPYIFDRAYRLQKSRTGEAGHAGLGLAIARRILEIHGGTLHADSQPGRGTAITFALPVPGLGPV